MNIISSIGTLKADIEMTAFGTIGMEEEAKAEAMKRAVEDAGKKAAVLADASGIRITGIEEINEGGVYSYDNTVGNARAKGMYETEEASADAGTVVSAAKLIVSASVSITYEAEQQ